VALRTLGYEILWTLTAAVDVAAYRGLAALARADMLAADHPDLTSAALATLRGLPAHMCVDLMLGSGDPERTMCEAMSGDAPAHIRAASVVTFSRVAVHAYLQAADTRENGTARPLESHSAFLRMRATLLDRALEVLRGAAGACEDKDGEVAAAGFATVRWLVESAPYARDASAGGRDAAGLPSPSRAVVAGSLLDEACGGGQGGGGHGGCSLPDADPAATAALRAAYLRMVRELVRRTLARFGVLMQRVLTLRAAGRAHAVRGLTLLLAHAMAEASARTGALDPQAVLRMDHAAGTGEQPLSATVSAFVGTLLVPLATQPLGVGGVGAGAAAAVATDLSALAAASNNLAAAAAQLEACRAFVQLCGTFGARDGAARARSLAGAQAVADLDAVSGRAPTAPASGASSGSAVARALAIGALAVDTTNNYVLATLADADQGEFAGAAGDLWGLVGGGDPASAASSALGAHVAAVARRFAPTVLRGLTGLLRRVQSSGSGPGTVVSIAGGTSGDGGAGGADGDGGSGSSSSSTASSSSSSSSSPSSGAGASAGGLAPDGAVQGGVSAGAGLGSGAGSSIVSDGLLRRTLHVSSGLAELLEPALFLHVCPALLREAGRLADDVVDDAGAGFDHSRRRVQFLTRLGAMAVHTALVECAPDRPLGGYARGAAGGRGVWSSGGASSSSGRDDDASGAAGFLPPLPPPGRDSPAYSTLLARILHEATRPLNFGASTVAAEEAAGVGASGSGTDASSSSPQSSSSSAGAGVSSGDAHAAETSAASTRFRSELTAVLLQCLVRAAPTGSVLGPLAVATAHARRDPAVVALSRPRARVAAAEALHTWLCFALDTALACLWVLEHRLSYAGVAPMGKEAASAILARVMGDPDAPAPAPCPVPSPAPQVASVTGMSLAHGPSRAGDPTVGAVPDMFDPSMASSAAPPTGGQGFVTGWAWAREYEATAEAADVLLGLLCASAALLLPPPVAKTYIPGAQEGGATSIPAALALDMLPPAVLTAHRAGLQRVLHLCGKQDLGVCRMYELERAAHALAPRFASQAASVSSGLTASITRGTTYDALPSVLPVQLRLLWLLCAGWDGSDGGALTAGIVAAGTSARMSLPRSVAGAVHDGRGGGGAGGRGGGLRALMRTVSKAERAVAAAGMQQGGGGPKPKGRRKGPAGAGTGTGGAGGGGGGDEQGDDNENDNGDDDDEAEEEEEEDAEETEAERREAELFRNTMLSIEALRQKRLANLTFLLVAEAGTALGVGADLEAAAAHGAAAGELGLLASQSNAREQQQHMRDGHGGRKGGSGGDAGGIGGGALPWTRGSKIGKALGFFAGKLKAVAAGGGLGSGKGANEAGPHGGPDGPAWTGEGTVVTHAHFWVLLDALAQLASAQRCTAGLVKRAVECMLVLPKLSPDVEDALLALLPRLSLFAAAYGRSQVAGELASAAQQQEMDGGGGGEEGGEEQPKQQQPTTSVAEAGAALRTAVDSTSIFAAVAGYATACSTDPWGLTLYVVPEPDDDEGDNSVSAASSSSSARRMSARLASFRLADDPSAPAATLEMLADMHSQPALAAVAAASLPELTQNVTLGLPRSAASGARMRTIPPIAAAFRSGDVASALAQVALHAGPSASFRTRDGAMCLPVRFLGTVPAETAVGAGDGEDEVDEAWEQDAADNNEDDAAADAASSSSSSAAASASPLSWARLRRSGDAVLLDAVVRAHARRDPVFRGAALCPVGRATATTVTPSLFPDGGSSSVVLTASSDPVSVTISHTLHPAGNRATLHLAVGNLTHVRFPAGLRVSLQLSGPLVFDRGSVTTAMVASTTARLGGGGGAGGGAAGGGGAGGSAGGGGGGGMGSAAAGTTLSGDFLTMQRTSQHHATHTLTQGLPAGAVVTWDVVVSVAGFGTCGVRACLVVEGVEVLPQDAAAAAAGGGGGGAGDEAAAALVRASRAVGATSAEDVDGGEGGEGDEDVDWEAAGQGTGGITAPWALPLLAPGQQPMAGDGLLWTGAALTGAPTRLLPAMPVAGITIGRTSAVRAPAPAPASGGPGGARNGAAPPTGGSSRTLSRLGSGFFGGGPSGSSSAQQQQRAGASGAARRPSSQTMASGVGAGSATDRDSEHDGASTAPPGEGDDDAGGGDEAGDGGGDGAGGDGGELGEEGPGTSVRPYRTRRIEIHTQQYRIPATALLFPLSVRMPPALAVALAAGVELRNGDGGGLGLGAAAGGGGGHGGGGGGGAVGSLPTALFASVAARVPYVHHAVAVSQPFIATPSGLLPPPAARASRTAALSMASPDWLVACAVEGTRGRWARIPLPVSTLSLSSSSSKSVRELAAEYASGAAGGGSAAVSSQAAFCARTWSAATVVVLMTGVLVPVGGGEGAGGGGLAGAASSAVADALRPQPCLWNVSLEVRTDDARVRAVLSAELPLLVHELFCGRLSVLAHGHAALQGSASAGLLAGAGAQPSAPAPAQALARMQAASAGLEARVARGEWGGMLGGWAERGGE
jgi:hypothetical protein